MKWQSFFMVLVWGFLFVPVSLSGLTPEEKVILPELSKEELIEIIIVYDQNLNEIEFNLTEKEVNLNKLEVSLNEKETELIQTENTLQQKESSLNEREGQLNLRASLLAGLYTSATENSKSAYWRGFRHGAGVGGLTSGIGLYLIK